MSTELSQVSLSGVFSKHPITIQHGLSVQSNEAPGKLTTAAKTKKSPLIMKRKSINDSKDWSAHSRGRVTRPKSTCGADS